MPKIKFQPQNKIPFDSIQIQVRVLPGVRDKLKAIPDWQEKLRGLIDQLILDHDNRE
jgi:hypothetical protein